ncbi:immune inhibitor A domain-containing protein [Vallitalea guaymasensis]|uniref:Immune inhibitor A n=1 Tax=Vallitalea guaymasensis TaxID=1185412 RepID=A0A8J8SAT0_9FIRM|nr:immune inhibitor A domain-containing protein [Vallitalea guaymasensis]QUH27611.1 immune inhibitor A [Vallitalea guaymasensis]
MIKKLLCSMFTTVLLVGLFASHVNAALLDQGPVEAKPLVILMDFPDYRYSDFLDREVEGDILSYSDNYEAAYYQDMLFGPETYEGKDNKYFMTMNKYFKLESREQYSVNGGVAGWYTAKNNALHYGNTQKEASWLVEEGADAVSQDTSIKLADYDVIDKSDYDNDGNYYEPDGLIDTVILVHAGKGEEWYSGGSIGAEAAIWPFQSSLSGYREDKSPYEVVDTNGNTYKFEDFVMVEQDAPVGLISHEYGHSLGLPDLYGNSEPVQNWTTMAGGSYAGYPIGSMTVGYGAYCREQLQKDHGGDWQRQNRIHLEDIGSEGMDVTLIAASSQNSGTDAVRIDLPDKVTTIVEPYSGDNTYYGGKEDAAYHYMTTNLDFTVDANKNIQLKFKTQYDIEEDWDYGYVQVREEGTEEWTAIEGNITTTENPNIDEGDFLRNPGHGITGNSGGNWVDGIFDISDYAGKKIDLRIGYGTDGNTQGTGFFVDDIRITVNDEEVFFDDAEGELRFVLDGFEESNGVFIAENYYLIEWRNQDGSDEGLKQSYYYSDTTPYDPGLLIWYIDRTYGTLDRLSQDGEANPGHVSVGIVDADQEPVIWKYPNKPEMNVDKVEYQMHDAAFSLRNGAEYFIQWNEVQTIDVNTNTIYPIFNDSRDYSSPDNPAGGLILPQHGIKILVTEENADRSEAKIHIMNVHNVVPQRAEPKDIKIQNVRIALEQVTDVEILNDLVIVEASGDLGTKGYIGYIDENEDEKVVQLELQDGKYVGTLSDQIFPNDLDWRVNFIALEDSQGGMKAIYNSEVHDYGVDLSSGNISGSTSYVKSLEMIAVIKENTSLGFGLIGTLDNGNNASESDLSKVEWSSSDESVANVDSQGIVTGMTEGNATITAKLGGVTTSYKVMVVSNSSTVHITNETEPNNTFSDANGPIGNNQMVSASYIDGDNADYYNFDVLSHDTIKITVTGDGNMGFNWLLFKESDQSNYVDYPDTGGNILEGSYEAVPGKYYLKVYKHTGNSGTYTVNIDGALK